jgi:HK97 family phage major capsid protein
MDNVGMILPLITKTSYKAGVEIPTSSVKPVATWVAEGAGSDRQKKVTGKISFTYHKLRCEISMSMEVGTMALAAFEAKFVENVAKAMTYAVENAVINGTGSGQPKGILAETGAPVTGSINYGKVCECEAAIPVEYETGSKWCMNKKTFMQFIAMTDNAGQPIARVNHGIAGKAERTILGRDVVISPYVADNKAFIFDFADYVLNTIYDMGISKKQDWDTEVLLTKAVMSVDGKAVDAGSLVVFDITPTI